MNRWLTLLLWVGAWSGYAQQRTWDTIPNLPEHYQKRVAAFKAQPMVKGKTVFLGNSITESGNWKKLLGDSSVINRGISGDITFGVQQRLPDIIALKPAKLFLMIGINDLSKGIPDEIVLQNILSIVYAVHKGSPQTKIYVQSLLPVNPTVEQFPQRFNKADHILTINAQLARHVTALGGTYIDLHSKFTDDQGNLKAAYTYDGLHLTAAGYKHWVAVLRSLKYL